MNNIIDNNKTNKRLYDEEEDDEHQDLDLSCSMMKKSKGHTFIIENEIVKEVLTWDIKSSHVLQSIMMHEEGDHDTQATNHEYDEISLSSDEVNSCHSQENHHGLPPLLETSDVSKNQYQDLLCRSSLVRVSENPTEILDEDMVLKRAIDDSIMHEEIGAIEPTSDFNLNTLCYDELPNDINVIFEEL